MNIWHYLKRMHDIKFFRHFLFTECVKKHKNKTTADLIKKNKGKKILLVHASPFNHQMLKQRPHHFVDFWAKHFDCVMYWSLLVDEPKIYRDNIYLVPYTPTERFKDVEIFFYMSSVSCISYKKFLKIKKNGYKIIYDYYDEFSDSIANTKHSAKSHNNLAKINPQLIITTSQRLYDDMKSKIPTKEEIYLIKNGVTVEDFMKTPKEIPNDLINIVKEGQPIVGYYGYLADWIDLELIEKCLAERPDYNFVFIGKAHAGYNYKNLLKYKNFYFLGHKEYKELYKYSTKFDCAIIPFKLGNIAKATSPNKLFEFMAVGIPTVCTRDMVECRGFDGVLVSENNENFVKDIDKAIELAKNEEITEKLRKTALDNTWESKAEQIYKLMGKIF